MLVIMRCRACGTHIVTYALYLENMYPYLTHGVEVCEVANKNAFNKSEGPQ